MPVDGETTYIESLGVYLPPDEISSKSRVAGIKSGIRFPLDTFTGIESTRRVSPGEHSFDLACRAVEQSLERSRFGVQDFGLLIACNISKYDHEGFVFPIEPSTATRLRKAMGFRNAIAFDVSNACAGMFTGILIADCFLHATSIDVAMVVSGEYISHLADAAQLAIASLADSRLACLTLGDSGAAVVLARSKDRRIGFRHMELCTLGVHSSLCYSRFAAEAGRGAIMITDSSELLRVGTLEAAQHFFDSIRACEWSVEEIDHVIGHQVSKGCFDLFARQINAQLTGVKLARDKVVDNLPLRGNTATTTHVVALHDRIEQKRIRSGDRVAFSVTASGLTVGTALYVLDDLPSRLRDGHASKERVPIAEMPPYPNMRAAPGVSIGSVASTRLRCTPPASTEEIAVEAAEACLAKAACRREDVGVLIFGGVFKSGFLAEPSYASILAGKLFPKVDSVAASHALLAFDLHHGPNGFLAACEIVRTMMAHRRIRAGLVLAAEFDENRLLRGYPQLGIAEVASAALVLPAGSPGVGLRRCEFFSFDQYADSFQASAVAVSPVHVCFQAHQDHELYLRSSIRNAIEKYLSRNGWALQDFEYFYFPQISSAFLRKLAEDIGLPWQRIVDVTVPGKDLSTSSLPCILEEVTRRGANGDSGMCLAVSAGPGINVGCAVIGGQV